MKYTPQELDQAAIADLLNDAEASEKQAKEGPFFPERGITPESCMRYAAECRATASAFSNKRGAHDFVLNAPPLIVAEMMHKAVQSWANVQGGKP